MVLGLREEETPVVARFGSGGKTDGPRLASGGKWERPSVFDWRKSGVALGFRVEGSPSGHGKPLIWAANRS